MKTGDKLYIVQWNEYTDQDVFGVYSTQERANDALKQAQKLHKTHQFVVTTAFLNKNWE